MLIYSATYIYLDFDIKSFDCFLAIKFDIVVAAYYSNDSCSTAAISEGDLLLPYMDKEMCIFTFSFIAGVLYFNDTGEIKEHYNIIIKKPCK